MGVGGWGGGRKTPQTNWRIAFTLLLLLVIVSLRILFLANLITIFNFVLISVPRHVYSKIVTGAVTHFILPPTDLFSHWNLKKKKFVIQQGLTNGLM